ncbi:unnamed protein product [Haemonchus placei]|uniref:CBS domain-containing protein n=1 Tax=Haemonchus placei TaxID=6290 RepID=A0A158QPP8_HAEPC|nr:unnamed protein product [Haemonchus placei]
MSQLSHRVAPRQANGTPPCVNIYCHEPTSESTPEQPASIRRHRFASGILFDSTYLFTAPEQPASIRRHRFASGLRGLMGRPRSESLSGQLLRKSTKLKKVQVNGCNLTSVYDLRECEEGSSDFYDDDWAFRRPRSNSSDFLILRKTSRPLSVDVVGLVESQSDPYRQYMRVVDCYELSPQAGNVIALDKSIKVDRAFSALCEQNVRAGLVWDGSLGRITSIVTLTDFLTYMREDASQSKRSQSEICDLISDTPLVTVFADMKVIEACEQFCLHRVHRIIVREPQSGDILYLLTIKRVLQAIHKQNRSLHFAQWLSSPIKDSGVGTWEGKIHSVSLDDCLNDVLEKMLSHRLSSVPVINSNGHAVDVVTKSDLAMALMEVNAHHTFFSDTTVSTVLGRRPAAVFVRPNDPVGKVLDALLEAQRMRCVFVVDDHKTPIACVSQSDVISHLIYDERPFQKPKSPATNSQC